MALVVRITVAPGQQDALMEELEASRDSYLPNCYAVRAVAIHSSSDRALVADIIQVTSAVLMSLTQLKPRLMPHERRLNAIWRIGRGRHIPVGTGGRPS